jgi:hypothetical protein
MSITYLYLDQRDLIDLSNGKNFAIWKKLDELLSSKKVRIVLSFMHIIETWKYANRTERWKVALFADSLYPVWIINRNFLFREEIRAALWEYLGVSAMPYWPSQRDDEELGSALVKYRDGSKQYRFCPFRRSIMETFQKNREMNKQRTSGKSDFPKGFADMLEAIENNPKIPSMLGEIHQAYPEFITSWRDRAKGPLPGKIDFLRYLASEAYATPALTSEILDDFLRWLDTEKCPSLYCYLRVKDEINKDKLSIPYPSEMVDIIHITALPYCDAFSTDKRIWDYIRRCRIEKKFFERGRTRTMCAFKLLTDAIEWIESYVDS